VIINPYRFASGSAGTYLDSLIPAPRAVYSLRKKYSTATSAYRVRRSSDNAEQDIGFSGDAHDTAALGAFVGAGSGFVVTWYDQTGNGEHFNQVTAANQPRIVNAGAVQSEITFDNSNDYMVVTSLAMGSPYVGLYMKGTIPASAGSTDVLLEMSTNYNNNAQSWVVYVDSTAGGDLKVSSRNSTAAGDYRLQAFNASGGAGQLTILFDRTTTGTNEIMAWKNGSARTSSASGTPADQTGNYSAYDLYMGGRVSGSLYSALQMETLVVYNTDTSGGRTSIEAIVA
jgi:hypothetical protein